MIGWLTHTFAARKSWTVLSDAGYLVDTEDGTQGGLASSFEFEPTDGYHEGRRTGIALRLSAIYVLAEPVEQTEPPIVDLELIDLQRLVSTSQDG